MCAVNSAPVPLGERDTLHLSLKSIGLSCGRKEPSASATGSTGGRALEEDAAPWHARRARSVHPWTWKVPNTEANIRLSDQRGLTRTLHQPAAKSLTYYFKALTPNLQPARSLHPAPGKSQFDGHSMQQPQAPLRNSDRPSGQLQQLCG